MDVGTVRRKASKQDKKENVLITEMARRVRNWGIAKPQNAQNCVWTWGFKYKNPPKCAGGFQNHALCSKFAGPLYFTTTHLSSKHRGK